MSGKPRLCAFAGTKDSKMGPEKWFAHRFRQIRLEAKTRKEQSVFLYKLRLLGKLGGTWRRTLQPVRCLNRYIRRSRSL